MHPLLARYEAAALPALEAGLGENAPLRETVQALGAARFEVADPVELFNVNTPEDLARRRSCCSDREG